MHNALHGVYTFEAIYIKKCMVELKGKKEIQH